MIGRTTSRGGFATASVCAGCPFRREGKHAVRGLSAARLAEIVEASSSKCHRTVPDTGGKPPVLECLGFLAYRWAQGETTQLLRIAGRLGMIRPGDLDAVLEAGTVETEFGELVELHNRRCEP